MKQNELRAQQANLAIWQKWKKQKWLSKNMAISILFFARNRTRDNFFELFAKVFRRSRSGGIFFDGPKIFQILADSAAIRLVQKSSKSEPSSRFFSHLKFRKSLPGSVLPKFPRRIQNRNGQIFRQMDSFGEASWACLPGSSALGEVWVRCILANSKHDAAFRKRAIMLRSAWRGGIKYFPLARTMCLLARTDVSSSQGRNVF